MSNFLKTLVFSLVIMFPATALAAGIPVVDSANLSQNAANFAKEIKHLADQLETAKQHVQEQIKQFESLTGDRGMAQLLDGTIRNYLPDDWEDAISLLNSPNGYSDITSAAQELIEKRFNDENNTRTLKQADLDKVNPEVRETIEKKRDSIGLANGLLKKAYNNAQERVKALESLTSKISQATDPKAILDLQARIETEQGQLQIEQTKLTTMSQKLIAEEAIQEQEITEMLVKSGGSLRGKKW